MARHGKIQDASDAEQLSGIIEGFYLEVTAGSEARAWQEFFRRNYREKLLAAGLALAQAATRPATGRGTMKLAEKLDRIRESFAKKLPAEAKALMARATEDLRASGILGEVVERVHLAGSYIKGHGE